MIIAKGSLSNMIKFYSFILQDWLACEPSLRKFMPKAPKR
jgi:hypothetical protein